MKNQNVLEKVHSTATRTRPSLLRVVAIVLATILLSNSARAAARIWANFGSDFATAANWGGTVPTGNNVAQFTSAETVNPILAGNATASFAGLYFKGTGVSGYDLTRSSSGTFTLMGIDSTGSNGTTSNSAVAIRSENISGTNTIEVPLTLTPASGSTSVFYQAAGGALVVKGAVAGSSIALQLKGGGTIELDGDNSALTGGMSTNTDAGTVVIIGNNNALGGTNGNGAFTVSASSTLQAGGGARTISNAVTLASGALTIGGTNDLTFSSTGSFTASTSAATRTLTVINTGNTTLAGNVFLSALSSTGVTLTIGGSGATKISGTVANFNGTGSAGSFAYNGSNTLTLTGNNTYTGTTSVTTGTLKAAGTGGNKALGSTTQVTVSNGGSLLLGADNQIKSGAAISLGAPSATGGTFNTGGFSEGTAAAGALGALILTASSTLDLGAGNSSVLKFFGSSGSTWTTGAVLSIYNYSGQVSNYGTLVGTTGDALYFGNSASGLTGAQLANIKFYSDGGTDFLGFGTITSTGEVYAAVPEPTTLLGGVALLGLIVMRKRRRFATWKK